MSKQIKIEDLIPFLKKGWVACDSNGIWSWFSKKPEIADRGFWEVYDDEYCLDWEKKNIVMFNIAPAEDWTESLIKVGCEK